MTGEHTRHVAVGGHFCPAWSTARPMSATAPTSHAWNPAYYSDRATLQHAWARSALRDARVQPQERVLDVGCGDGSFTAAIASELLDTERGGSILGVDVSADMIRFATEQHARPGAVSFVQADVGAQPCPALAGRQFDRCVSFNCLHWIHDHDAVFGNLAGCVREGGRLDMLFHGAGTFAALVASIEDARASERWRHHFGAFQWPWRLSEAAEVQRVAAAHGFHGAVRLEEGDSMHTAESLFHRLMIGWVAWTAVVPPEEREEFVWDVVRRYFEREGVAWAGRSSQDVQVVVRNRLLRVHLVRAGGAGGGGGGGGGDHAIN